VLIVGRIKSAGGYDALRANSQRLRIRFQIGCWKREGSFHGFDPAQLKTFVSTLARRSIIGLKTAAFTRLCIFRPQI
jgi:hypothetical protein